MVADLTKITNIENQRQADFNAFLIKVNKNIADLKENIERLDGQIQSNTECIARETDIINEATAKSNRNEDLKQKAIKMCAKFVEEVQEAQNARRIEVGVVRQILGLMKVRFGQVPERLTEYLDSVENGFAEYENKTKLIAYKVYKYMALNENELGKDITADKQAYVDNKKFSSLSFLAPFLMPFFIPAFLAFATRFATFAFSAAMALIACLYCLLPFLYFFIFA